MRRRVEFSSGFLREIVFFGEEAVVGLTIRTIDALLVKNFLASGLKFSILPRMQGYALGIAHDYGYVDRNGRGSRFDSDDYFLVTLTKGIMDDFDFNRSAITKLAMGLMIRELPQLYVPASESYELSPEFHGIDSFFGIDCCNNTPWNSEYRESCYKLSMKVLAESKKEEKTMEETSTTMITETTQDSTQPAPSEPSNEQLTAEIKVYLGQIGQNIIEVGKRLHIMKGRIPHGEWQNWLKDNFQLSYATAARFIQCAERFGNVVSIRGFNSTQMIAMLSLPAEETTAFIEAKAAEGKPVEKMTIRQLREEVQQWKARAEEADKKIADSNAKLSETQSELQDARNARDAAISAVRDAEEKLKNQ